MTCIRRFAAHDLFTFNSINLDYFTETVRPSIKCWVHVKALCTTLHAPWSGSARLRRWSEPSRRRAAHAVCHSCTSFAVPPAVLSGLPGSVARVLRVWNGTGRDRAGIQ